MNNEKELNRALFGTREEAIHDTGVLTGTVRVEYGGITIALEEVTGIPVTRLSGSIFIVKTRF